MYTYLNGKFPVTLIRNNKYILVLYHYDSNGILVEPMENCTDAEALRVYDKIYECLQQQGCKQKLNIMDNEASKAVQQ